MSAQMVTALSLEKPDGQFEVLLGTGRTISTTMGLTGLAARESIGPRPSGHGVLQRSLYRDTVPIEVDGELFGEDAQSAWDHWHALAAACAAAVGSDRELRWSIPGLNLSSKGVRLVSLSAPVEVDEDVLRYKLILRRGDPRSYSQSLTTAIGSALAVSGGGEPFAITFPMTFTEAGGGSVVFTVGGTDNTSPILRIYGYCTAPTLKLISTGEIITLTGEVAAGTYLEVDVARGQVRLADGTLRNNLLDHANSTLFDLAPGPQTIQISSANFDATARVDVLFYNAYA